MIKSPEEAGNKAAQLLGWPKYFRATLIKLQPAVDKLPPHWIVSADIGKFKKAANVCIMFPQDMEPTPDKPEDGTFEAKIWKVREDCRNLVEVIDFGLPHPPTAGSWWLSLDRTSKSLIDTLKTVWEDQFK